MNKLVYNIRAKTVSPVSITLPDQDGFPMMTIGRNADGTLVKTAYIPATSFRGKLRHALVLFQMAADAAKGLVWDLFRIYECLLGQDSQSESKDDLRVDIAATKKRRESNHIIDVWGCGLGVSARLKTGHLMPVGGVVVEPESFSSVRKDLDADASIFESMSKEDVEAFEKRNHLNAQRAELGKKIDAIEASLRAAKKEKDAKTVDALTAQKDDLKKQVDACAEQMGPMKNSTKSLFTISAMPAGTELAGCTTLIRPTAKDFEMMLKTFDLFSRDPIIGGNSTRGFGEIAGVIQISDDDGADYGAIEFGGHHPAKVTLTDIGKAFAAGK